MTIKSLLMSAAACAVCATAGATQNLDDVLTASLLPGWRQADGSHMAGIRLQMAPGWHTYWRAPGDAGIPPQFDLAGSRNLATMQVVWPRPEVYEQSGMRSIVYHEDVVLPVTLAPKSRGAAITFNAEITVGVCKDICVPQTLNVRATLPASGGQRDSRIAAALADQPLTAREAGASEARCTLTPTSGGMTLTAALSLPRVGKREAMVIETASPLLWVAEPELQRSGNKVTASTTIAHVEGAPFVLNRSGIRITVLGESRAVDIRGCSAG